MKSKQILTVALVGIAMIIAMPIVAAAGDQEAGGYQDTQWQAPGGLIPVGHHYGWRNHANYDPGLVCDEDGDDCHDAVQCDEDGDDCHPAVQCDEDGDDCEPAIGYEGHYYGPSYYGGPAIGGRTGRLLAAQARVSARIARARARGDWHSVNDGYRELRAIDGELYGLGASRDNRAYSAGSAFTSPTANGLLGRFAGVPAYNSYSYNSGYNGAYNAPYSNNGTYGTMSTLVPLLQQFVP